MTLTILQQDKFYEAAKRGLDLYSCLIMLGLGTKASDELCKSQEIQDLHVRGRCEGVNLVRGALLTAAQSGNVSAARALRMDEPDAQEEESYVPPRRVTAPGRDVIRSVTDAFEKQRKLMMECDLNE